VNVIFIFDKPIVKALPWYNGTATMESEGYKPDYTAYQFKAAQITTESFSIIVISKTPVFTTLYGINGVAGQ
jgi:hypothetical protein